MAVIDAVSPLRDTSLATASLYLGALALAALLVRDFVVWWRLRHVPGPFLNSITVFPLLRYSLRGDLYEYMKQLGDEYGPIVRIAPGQIMFTDADVFRRVGSPRAGYTKGPWYEATRFAPGENHIVCMRGDEERRIRKAKLWPGYQGKENVKGAGFEVGVDKQLLAFIGLLERKYISEGSNYRPVEFAHRANFLTLDIISEIAFSKAFGFIANDRDMHDYMRITQQSLPLIAILSTMPAVAKLMFQWPLNRMLPSEGDKVGFGRLIGFIKDHVGKRLAPGAEPVHDVLQSFIDHKVEGGDLIQEIIVQIVAGSDTTSSAIRFTLLHLINTPCAYRKLQAEIDAAEASGLLASASGVVSDANARVLPYLQAVIREGLRLFPPANGLIDKAVPGGGEEVCGYYLPGGTLVGQNMYGIARLKSFWGEDADLFRPERWLEEPSEAKLREMHAVVDLVFGYGKFQCLGKAVAFMELNKVFVELLKRYDMAVVNPLKPLRMRSAGVWVTNDYWLNITRREGRAAAKV